MPVHVPSVAAEVWELEEPGQARLAREMCTLTNLNKWQTARTTMSTKTRHFDVSGGHCSTLDLVPIPHLNGGARRQSFCCQAARTVKKTQLQICSVELISKEALLLITSIESNLKSALRLRIGELYRIRRIRGSGHS